MAAGLLERARKLPLRRLPSALTGGRPAGRALPRRAATRESDVDAPPTAPSRTSDRATLALFGARSLTWPPSCASRTSSTSAAATRDLLAVWRVHGLDAMLREAWGRASCCAGSAPARTAGSRPANRLVRPVLPPLHDGLGFLRGQLLPALRRRGAGGPPTRRWSRRACRRATRPTTASRCTSPRRRSSRGGLVARGRVRPTGERRARRRSPSSSRSPRATCGDAPTRRLMTS